MTIGSTEQAKALHDDEIYLGLFSVLETNAVVRNVNLTNVCINVSYGASAYIGDIAAYVYKGAIINCKTDVHASCTVKTGGSYLDKTSYDAADVSVFAGGKGTDAEPYLIGTEAQLRYIAEAMNEDVDWENTWFALDNDITLTGGDWLPMTEHNKEGLSHLLFYTNDGSDLNTWTKGDTSAIFSTGTEKEVTESETAKNIAADEALCSWVKIDYEKKTGTAFSDTSIQKKTDGQYEITLTDSSGQVLDKYVIDPKTGTGINAENAAINMPQTGNNSLFQILMTLAAMLMTGLGVAAFRLSGMCKRKDSKS